MRAFATLLVAVSTLVTYVQAQNSTALLEAAIKQLPKCAVRVVSSPVDYALR